MAIFVTGYIVISALLLSAIAIWFVTRYLKERRKQKQGRIARQKADRKSRVLFDQAEDLYRQKKYAEALKNSTAAIKLLQGSEDQIFKARVSSQMSRIHGALRNFDLALHYTAEAKRILGLSAFKDHPLFETLAINQATWEDEKVAVPIRKLLQQARTALSKGEREEALAHAHEAVDMVPRILKRRNHWVTVSALYELGRAQIGNGQYQEARETLALAFGMADEWVTHINKNTAKSIEQLIATCDERLGF